MTNYLPRFGFSFLACSPHPHKYSQGCDSVIISVPFQDSASDVVGIQKSLSIQHRNRSTLMASSEIVT